MCYFNHCSVCLWLCVVSFFGGGVVCGCVGFGVSLTVALVVYSARVRICVCLVGTYGLCDFYCLFCLFCFY